MHHNINEPMAIINTGRPYAPKNVGLLKVLSRFGQCAVSTLAAHMPEEQDISARLRNMSKHGAVRRCSVGKVSDAVWELTDAGRQVLRNAGSRSITISIKKSKTAQVDIAAQLQARNAAPYSCPELRSFPTRPGAMDAYSLPSRMGNWLHFRDGRVERMPVVQEAA